VVCNIFHGVQLANRRCCHLCFQWAFWCNISLPTTQAPISLFTDNRQPTLTADRALCQILNDPSPSTSDPAAVKLALLLMVAETTHYCSHAHKKYHHFVLIWVSNISIHSYYTSQSSNFISVFPLLWLHTELSLRAFSSVGSTIILHFSSH
jgi:hypothetical protein